MKNTIQIILVPLFFSLTNCKIADISESSNLPVEQSEQIATEKLTEVVKNQGFDLMKAKNVYAFTGTDEWNGFLGKMAKIWPDTKTDIRFKHNFNTFDGNGIFLNGEKEGDLIGVQSWMYYEKKKGQKQVTIKDTGTKENPLEFGMVIYHYFLELPYRLQKAPIKRYYGQKKHKNQQYDLIFASWGSEMANKEHDQYIIWINQATKLVDYCVYTVRANTNPLTRQKYGSIGYLNYREIEGFKVPTLLPVFLDDGILTTPSFEDYFHQLSIRDFTFGGFEEKELYPLPNLKKQYDEK